MSIGRKKEKDKSQKKNLSYIELEGAYDNGIDAEPRYTPRGKLAVHPTKITFIVDHMITISQYKLTVMETCDEILAKIKGED